ncbi:MAG TPA: DsbA family protein [Caulobacteraceae bacterium]|nr:DsbA family protein [Caulobacteraceae bacterium]
MEGLHFIFFADPMCSWCWGFAPVVSALRRRYGEVLPMRLVMGGLRPGTDAPMTAEAKAQMRGYWATVAQTTGQAFDDAVLEDGGFIYDTDPGARAVVLARRTSQGAALDYLERAQRAFYAEGRDITRPGTLADLAAELGFDRDAFGAALAEDGLRQETWRDYAISQRAGVTGFPTLIVGPKADGTYAMVSQGYAGAGPIVSAIDAMLATVRPAEA